MWLLSQQQTNFFLYSKNERGKDSNKNVSWSDGNKCKETTLISGWLVAAALGKSGKIQNIFSWTWHCTLMTNI